MFKEGQKVRLKGIVDVFKSISYRKLTAYSYRYLGNIVTILGVSKDDENGIEYRIKEDGGDKDFHENLFV